MKKRVVVIGALGAAAAMAASVVAWQVSRGQRISAGAETMPDSVSGSVVEEPAADPPESEPTPAFEPEQDQMGETVDEPAPVPETSGGTVEAHSPSGSGALPVRRIPTEGREVVLTFDDGPSQYTEEILTILREEQVPAAFFWVAGQSGIGLARTLQEQGYQLGSHTVDHVRLTTLGSHEQQAEIQESVALLQQAGQTPVQYIRPPYGAYNQDTLAAASQAGLQVILWDVDSRDWELADNPQQIIRNVLNNVRPGSIILLHERPQTVQVLRDLVQALRDAGYTFASLPGAGERAAAMSEPSSDGADGAAAEPVTSGAASGDSRQDGTEMTSSAPGEAGEEAEPVTPSADGGGAGEDQPPAGSGGNL